jgi:signal transduction histidine kinase
MMKLISNLVKSSSPINVFERSLLKRMAIGQIVSIVLFCLLVSSNLLWQFHKQGDGETDREIYAVAKGMASAIAYENPLIGIPEKLKIVTNFLDNTYPEELHKNGLPIVAIRIFNQLNQEVHRSENYPDALLNPKLGATATLTINNREWRYISFKSPNQDITIHLSRTTPSFDEELWPIIQRFILRPMLWFIPLAALATYLAALKGLQPLTQLANLIAKRTAQDLSPLDDRSPYSETRPIIKEINSLLDRLKATLQRERSFLADAAHELRTPLAVIQVQADVLTSTDNPAEKLEASTELRQGIERTAALLKRLLMIARVDTDSFAPRYQQLDLSNFVQERVASLAPLAMKKSIDIDMSTTSAHLVNVDPESLISVIDNVLDNAIRYTPNGEKITITIHSDKTYVVLSIADSGIGIPVEHQEKVFERFFRVPGTEQYGSGLGLAIVKQVMTLHLGEVTLSAGLEGRGLTVCLKLPCKC